MDFVRVFSQNVSFFVTACRLAAMALRAENAPALGARRGAVYADCLCRFAQKLEMPWLLTSASSLTPALHSGQSRDG